MSSTCLAKSTQAVEEEQAERAGLSGTRSLGIGDTTLELLVTRHGGPDKLALVTNWLLEGRPRLSDCKLCARVVVVYLIAGWNSFHQKHLNRKEKTGDVEVVSRIK